MITFAVANKTMIVWEDFENAPETRWSYVADTVMGGVSDGDISFEADDQRSYVRLTGRVSTDNNGGFIQVRRRFDVRWPDDTTSIRLMVRGNGEAYYVFLRSIHGTRPWHSYRASFVTGSDWSDVSLPLADFVPSRPELPASLSASDVTGLGILAYGADFTADVSVAEISLAQGW